MFRPAMYRRKPQSGDDIDCTPTVPEFDGDEEAQTPPTDSERQYDDFLGTVLSNRRVFGKTEYRAVSTTGKPRATPSSFADSVAIQDSMKESFISRFGSQTSCTFQTSSAGSSSGLQSSYRLRMSRGSNQKARMSSSKTEPEAVLATTVPSLHLELLSLQPDEDEGRGESSAVRPHTMEHFNQQVVSSAVSSPPMSDGIDSPPRPLTVESRASAPQSRERMPPTMLPEYIEAGQDDCSGPKEALWVARWEQAATSGVDVDDINAESIHAVADSDAFSVVSGDVSDQQTFPAKSGEVASQGDGIEAPHNQNDDKRTAPHVNGMEDEVAQIDNFRQAYSHQDNGKRALSTHSTPRSHTYLGVEDDKRTAPHVNGMEDEVAQIDNFRQAYSHQDNGKRALSTHSTPRSHTHLGVEEGSGSKTERSSTRDSHFGGSRTSSRAGLHPAAWMALSPRQKIGERLVEYERIMATMPRFRFVPPRERTPPASLDNVFKFPTLSELTHPFDPKLVTVTDGSLTSRELKPRSSMRSTPTFVQRKVVHQSENGAQTVTRARGQTFVNSAHLTGLHLSGHLSDDTFRSSRRANMKTEEFEVQLADSLSKRPKDRLPNDVSNVCRYLVERPFFKKMAPQALQQIARIAGISMHPSGDIVFEQGDYGSTYYVILKGKIRICDQEFSDPSTAEQFISLWKHIIDLQEKLKTTESDLRSLHTVLKEKNLPVAPLNIHPPWKESKWDQVRKAMNRGKLVQDVDKLSVLDVVKTVMGAHDISLLSMSERVQVEKVGRLQIEFNSLCSDFRRSQAAVKAFLKKRDGFKTITSLHQGNGFGEIALEHEFCLRNASVVTQGRTLLITIDRSDYNTVIRAQLDLEMQADAVILKQVPFLNHWRMVNLVNLRRFCQPLSISFGQYVVQQGRVSDAIFILKTGTVRVYRQVKLLARLPELSNADSIFNSKSREGRNKEMLSRRSNIAQLDLATLGPVAVFGGMCVLTGQAATESVVVVSQSAEFLVLTKNDVKKRIDDNTIENFRRGEMAIAQGREQRVLDRLARFNSKTAASKS